MKASFVVLAVLAAFMAVALAEDVCTSKITCGDCVKSLSCVWCPEEGPSNTGGCYHGKPWGKIDDAPITKCKSYKYLQCKIPGLALLILVSAGAGLVLILLFCCICCCCCCRRGRKSTTTVAMVPAHERYDDGSSSRDGLLGSSINSSGSAYSSHPVTDQRRREMNEKYNKYRSPAESYY